MVSVTCPESPDSEPRWGEEESRGGWPRRAEPSALRPSPHLGPAQPRALFLTAVLPSLELRRPSQREMPSGHLRELIVLLLQLYSPKSTFIDACEVLGHKEHKTGIDTDPACFPVVRRLIDIGPLRK